ncbi:MAG: hypothetical protein IJR08_03345 [Bacilli bacterium]|nr:hypothetical protein [Bacilli bacterium]
MSKKNNERIKSTIIIKNRNWWHIRKYYRSGHGALIVGESGQKNGDYYFLNITKNPPVGYSYFETEKPINQGKQKSHIRLYLQKGKKKTFSRWTMKYELSNQDLDKIEEFLEKKKKRL